MGLDNIRLGKRIKAARKRRGLSQMALSEALDLHPKSSELYREWEQEPKSCEIRAARKCTWHQRG